MEPNLLEQLFRTDDERRDNFLSKLFGLFSENVVRFWCKCPEAEYENLGRPTLRKPDERRGCTLDFTLKRKRGPGQGSVFVAEMKCWPAYENYRYLRLTDAKILERVRGEEAFERFLALAAEPTAFEVQVSNEGHTVPIPSPRGAILVWSATTPEGREATMAHYGLADVLSVEAMLNDLRTWACPSWREYVEKLRGWSMSLFDFLDGSSAGT